MPAPPSVLLRDPNSPRHTAALLRALFAHLKDGLAKLPEPAAFDYVSLPTLPVPTPKLIFQTILSAIQREFVAQSEAEGLPQKDEHIVPFHTRVDETFESFEGKFCEAIRLRAKGNVSRYKLCLVIEQPSRIRDLWPDSVLSGFLRLSDTLKARRLLPGRVTLMFVSELPWHHFRHPDGTIASNGPDEIHFQDLTKDEMVASLKLNHTHLWNDWNEATAMDPSLPSISEQRFSSLYSNFCEYAFTSFRAQNRDVVELQLLCAATWHVFLVPIKTGEVKATSFQVLLSHVRQYIRDALTRLHSRELSPREWISASIQAATSESLQRMSEASVPSSSKNPSDSLVDVLERDAYMHDETRPRRVDTSRGKRKVILPEEVSVPTLPRNSALLLVAAFMACYDPPKQDLIRFGRRESSMSPAKKKKGGATAKARASAATEGQKDNLKRPQLVGPRAVLLERILSIFQVLLNESMPDREAEGDLVQQTEMDEEEVAERSARVLTRKENTERMSRSAAIFQEIKSMIAQRFLLTSSKTNELTGMTVQVNITYEVAQSLAKRENVKLEDWLDDWRELYQ
ncbi:hypothetical protein OC846_003064 [Tilletia horrida]|uniref:Uncharacterized protein n=1 Tax=Tilletia horrida TaxID=155126 RepID=A0AAN6GQT0_9BASI|nr:hypothetical protein OC845_002821 [Tilletia horrida]KAK0551980.1 hypothetical protein OC846_003064 [Tilletia horrida]